MGLMGRAVGFRVGGGCGGQGEGCGFWRGAGPVTGRGARGVGRDARGKWPLCVAVFCFYLDLMLLFMENMAHENVLGWRGGGGAGCVGGPPEVEVGVSQMAVFSAI